MDTTGTPALEGDGEEDEEEVPIPPNLQSKDAPPDTSGAAAARDSAGISLPASPALPDTLHPSGLPADPQGKGAPGLPPVPKPKGGIFGLTPVVIILGLAVIHVLVIRAVGG